jgi:hypothetical protein
VVTVDGARYERSRAGIQAAIDSVPGGRPSHIVVASGEDIVSDGTPLRLDKDYCWLEFKCRYRAPPGEIRLNLIEVGRGAMSPAGPLDADGLELDTAVICGSIAAIGLQPGDVVEIGNNNLDSTETLAQVNRVTAIEGNRVRLAAPLTEAFTTAANAVLRKLTDPVVGARVSGPAEFLDGSDNGGSPTRGVVVTFARNCDIDVDGVDLPGSALLLYHTWGCRVRAQAQRCGRSEADIYVQRSGALTAEMRSYCSQSFGPELVHCGGAVVPLVMVQQATDRSFKLLRSSYVQLGNVQLFNGSSTGFSPAFGSRFGTVQTLVSIGHARSGIWFPDNTEGQGNIDNWVIQRAIALGNGREDGNFDLYLGSTSDNNRILHADYATLSDASAANSIGSSAREVFTTTGTWTKRQGATTVEVVCIGGGGGGGSGRRGAAGSNRFGGGGGGGGSFGRTLLDAAQLGASESVTVGAGGAGAPAINVDDTDGIDGAEGGATSFGAWLTAPGGRPGRGGAAAARCNGESAGGGAGFAGGDGGASSVTSPAGRGSNLGGTSGGGAGGGISARDVPQAGGEGAASAHANVTGGGAGASDGGHAGPVADIGSERAIGGAGGGGGGGAMTTGGGNGSGGGAWGGGGGGGGAALNGFFSGAGGDGGAGICIVITHF